MRPRRRHAVAAIVVIALTVRIAVVIATPHFQAVTDAGDFDYTAVTLVHDHRYPSSGLAPRGGPTAFRPPLFPIALAGAYELSGTGSKTTRWTAGRVLEALLGALAVLLVYLVATRIWTPVVGLVAAGAAAVEPSLVMAGSSLLSEALFIPLVLAATLAALAARDSGRLRLAIAAGVLVGLSALARGNGLLLVVPAVFMVWTGRPRFTRAALRAPLVLLAAAVLTLAPWTIRNYHVFGQLVPVTTETGYALAGTYNAAVQARTDYPALWTPPVTEIHQVFVSDPTANEAQASQKLTSMALHYIRAHPGSLFKTLYWNALRLLNLTGTRVERAFAGGEGYPNWLAVASVYAFWVVLALALVGMFTTAARRAPGALWWFPAVILLSAMVLLGLTRYRTPADPFFLLLASLGAISLAERARSALRKREPVTA